MKRRRRTPAWALSWQRSLATLARLAAPRARSRAPAAVARGSRAIAPKNSPAAAGTWIAGRVIVAGGTRRWRLFRPSGIRDDERVPLLVMLHGCGQDAEGFAASTRMNPLAQQQRFMVLYPEQDRLSNAQGCWNWFDTRRGRAQGEAALIAAAIDQVCRLHPADAARVALVGLSAGASMAALLATLQPARFKAVVAHSGVAPGAAHSPLSAVRAMQGLRKSAPSQWPGAAMAGLPPLLVIHGDADAVVAPHNGRELARLWAEATGARAGAERHVQRGRRHAAAVLDFKHQGRTRVSLVAVRGLAHAWSGGAASQAYSDARGPDASRLAWAFAVRQFRA